MTDGVSESVNFKCRQGATAVWPEWIAGILSFGVRLEAETTLI